MKLKLLFLGRDCKLLQHRLQCFLYLWGLFFIAPLKGGTSYSSTDKKSCSGNISPSEYIALEGLYNATDGTNWIWRRVGNVSSHWHFPSNLSAPCEEHWQGIICKDAKACQAQNTEIPCCISEIVLPRYNLYGRIPSSLAFMSSLEVLWLGENLLHGTIPPELGNLTAMESLILSVANLNGPIPMELGNLRQLSELSLEANHLTGTVPTSLGRLSNLTGLALYINFLSGPIPSELGLLRNPPICYVVGII